MASPTSFRARLVLPVLVPGPLKAGLGTGHRRNHYQSRCQSPLAFEEFAGKRLGFLRSRIQAQMTCGIATLVLGRYQMIFQVIEWRMRPVVSRSLWYASKRALKNLIHS